MPPTISGSRVPIGGGSVGSSANMNSTGRPSAKDGSGSKQTFNSATSTGGRGAGGPQQKMTGTVPSATGERVGGGGEKATSTASPIGLKGTIKSGKNASAKPQPESPTQGRY